jgi:hypothetical protein
VKLHTSLTETEIRACLDRAKADGEVPADIEFDVLGTIGSRSHQGGFGVHLATARNDTRADGRKRRPAAYGKYAATYDEWGWFLAAFFAADPGGRAGPYKSRAGFHASTGYAYASGLDDMPGDTAPAGQEQEPYRDTPDTEPVSNAMLPDAERTLGRIDAALAGYWVNTISPA